ncbi:MAG: hypothetical protein GXO74_03385 [Calditrichaeota bacterium]|nr:hypothetical protein [Calditrichota bacterium]
MFLRQSISKKKRTVFSLVLFSFLLTLSCGNGTREKINLKKEYLTTLRELTAALINLQISDSRDTNFGALQCPSCDVLHTRAAEAVYPFAVIYKETGDKKYLSAAKNLGDWLIDQQQPDGSWQETPEEWTGTTTDQLLMMVSAYQILKNEMSEAEQRRWEHACRAAARYLVKVMSPQFASINYCATTTASLSTMYRYFPDKIYLEKAKKLAHQVIAKMNEDGFINAEGGRIYGNKYGADIGYEMDMSLWGLGLYARLTGDKVVEEKVKQSLQNHLYFVYPNGAIDGSWGIRSNKWTMFGSATADGCQILFTLFAAEDSRYPAAAIKNLRFLKSCMKNGIIGYGPQYWEIFADPPCVYPTVMRAKNLAMATEIADNDKIELQNLPSENVGMVRYFPSMNVIVTRTKNFMATVTAYNYKDLKRKEKSKYMHRPAGGSISHLWAEGFGPLQISSQTEYRRWEPMHFPDVGEIKPLTPRIEFENENGYFTNLYEFDGRLSFEKNENGATVAVTTNGELCDKFLFPGGVAYQWTHEFYDDKIVHIVKLRYHSVKPEVAVVEPFVFEQGTEFRKVDEQRIEISGKGRTFVFELLAGEAEIELGKDAEKYWAVYPAVRCYPILLKILPPEQGFEREVKYRISTK